MSYEPRVTHENRDSNHFDDDAELLTEARLVSDVSTWNNLSAEIPYSAPISFSLKPIDRERLESVPLAKSAGRKAAEMVIPYPPGIPILYPGEDITAEMEQRLLALRHAGAKCQGISDPTRKPLSFIRKREGRNSTLRWYIPERISLSSSINK